MTTPSATTTLRAWFMQNYPHDDLGKEISPQATFLGLFETLDFRQDVYQYIGVGDSLIREALFEGLALLMDCDYDYIYDQWLRRN